MAVFSATLLAAVEKAEARAARLGEGLARLRDAARDATPGELASATVQAQRQAVYTAIHGASPPAEQAFERIINGNELQDVNYLARGALVAEAVLRIALRSAGGTISGTGFLVGEGMLLTNHHVLPDAELAALGEAIAFDERTAEGQPARQLRYALRPDLFFFNHKQLDFALVALAPRDTSGAYGADQLGWLPLIGGTGKVMEGEWMTVIQHPRGERKQLCVRENQLLKRDADVLWYSSDTLGGSSGSPVFNNDWLVVALHHSGVPEKRNSRWQTIDGRDFDPNRDSETDVKWIANEGIRVSRIVETLRADPRAGADRRVQAMLAVDIGDIAARLPVMRRAAAAPLIVQPSRPAPPSPPETKPMSDRLITVTLALDAQGNVRLADSSPAPMAESFTAPALEKARAPAAPKPVIEAPVEPARDWVHGFDPDFLGKGDLRVNLPRIDDSLADDVAPLLAHYAGGKKVALKPDDPVAKAGVLPYLNYSVVMSKARRLAFFSAANVNWGMRPAVHGRQDNWMIDERIDRKYQVDNSLYARNAIDRGHLTRREDLEWGADPVSAVRSANNTCTWTNCTPQHKIFNQDKYPDKSVQLWQALERYILEQTAEHFQFSVQAITGPIFGQDDPLYREVAIPLQYWKVVAAVDKRGKLFATGYVLSQKRVLDEFGTEEAAVETPFGAFATYQRPLSEIEAATGLHFTYGTAAKPLSECDPLAKPAWRRRKRRGSGVGAQESFAAPGDDGALQSFDDVVLSLA